LGPDLTDPNTSPPDPRRSVGSAQAPEECPHVIHEQIRRLHGGEVAAAIEVGPVDDVVACSPYRRMATSVAKAATPIGIGDGERPQSAPACMSS
jgi:hypothetical protein